MVFIKQLNRFLPRAKLLICFHIVMTLGIHILLAVYGYQTEHDSLYEFKETEIRNTVYSYLCFGILLLMINMWENLLYWIDSRKKEFYIRRMCGAAKADIVRLYVRDHCIILLVSFFISYGICFAMLWTKIDLFNYIFWEAKRSMLFDAISAILPLCSGMLLVWRKQNADGFK